MDVFGPYATIDYLYSNNIVKRTRNGRIISLFILNIKAENFVLTERDEMMKKIGVKK